VSIFAYGQTGSGKTYTMGLEDQGIIPRAVDFLFENYSIEDCRVSFFEIYLDTVRDLLDPSNVMTNSASKYEATQRIVRSRGDLMDLIKKTELTKVVAETNCNERSSRSHSIFQIKLRAEGGKESYVNLIDLAGSERVRESKVEGERLKEAMSINKSLSALGDVIYALKEKSKHVPFRNSKLTLLLQPFLASPSAKCLMIVNLNPVSISESVQSLRFASKVNSIA